MRTTKCEGAFFGGSSGLCERGFLRGSYVPALRINNTHWFDVAKHTTTVETVPAHVDTAAAAASLHDGNGRAAARWGLLTKTPQEQTNEAQSQGDEAASLRKKSGPRELTKAVTACGLGRENLRTRHWMAVLTKNGNGRHLRDEPLTITTATCACNTSKGSEL